jgi:hypothetical protein
MIRINNLKEKELLIAYYFCGKSAKKLNRTEVYDMWCNWFKDDFRIDGQPAFKMADGELVYRKRAKSKNAEKIRGQSNRTFQNIYKWIKESVGKGCHDKAYFRQQLDAERNREYGRVMSFTKPLNIYITMEPSYKKLAYFKLVNYKKRGQTITSGDCDKMIEYLKKHECIGETTA